jgi:DNA-binding protein YbaB
MTDNNALRSLEQLRRDAQRLQAQLGRAVRHGQSTRDGSDTTGVVTVLLDADGAACDVLVSADWRRRLSLDELCRAICSADTDAAQRRALATTEALARLDEAHAHPSTLDGEATHADPEVTGRQPGPVDSTRTVEGVPRTLAQLTTAAWAALDDLARFTTAPPAVTGQAAGGAVRMQVGQGRILDCVVEPGWLARQDATTLTRGLRQALLAARAAAAEVSRPTAEFHERLADLLADAQATMATVTSRRPR